MVPPSNTDEYKCDVEHLQAINVEHSEKIDMMMLLSLEISEPRSRKMTREKAQGIVDRSMAHEKGGWSYVVVPIDPKAIVGQCDPCQKDNRILRKVTASGMDAMVCAECLEDDDDEWTIETIDADGASLGTFVDLGRAAEAIADRIRETSSGRAGDASFAEGYET